MSELDQNVNGDGSVSDDDYDDDGVNKKRVRAKLSETYIIHIYVIIC